MIVKKIDLRDITIFIERKKKKDKKTHYYIVYAKDIYGFKQIYGRFKNRQEATKRANELKTKFERIIKKLRR